MQFPKASLVIGALALGAAGSLCAADNPAQAAARMAMVQKLSELSAQSPPATNAAVTPKVAAAKPVKAKTPAVSKVKTLPPGNPSAPTAASSNASRSRSTNLRSRESRCPSASRSRQLPAHR